VVVRLKTIDNETKIALRQNLEERFGPATELQFRSVGPTVGRE